MRYRPAFISNLADPFELAKKRLAAQSFAGVIGRLGDGRTDPIHLGLAGGVG